MKKHLTFVFATAAFIGTSAAAQTYDWKAPGSASKKANPVPASAAALAKGKAIYFVQCAFCHGASGHGDGPAAAALVPKPRNLTDPAILGQSDGAIFWKLTQGRAPMPAFAGVSEKERWSVIHYIRSLGGGAVKPGPAPKPKPAASALPAAKSVESDTTALALIPQAELQTGPVSREEYNALLQRMAELEKRLVAAGGQSAAREVAVDQSLSELEEKSEAVSKLADSTRPGTTNFLLVGYGVAGFEDRPGESGKFYAGFNPIFLWTLSDRRFLRASSSLS
ncbi:MAG: cytochrome c [Chthoniobacteraceae bacterium]